MAGLGAFLILAVVLGLFLRSESNRRRSVRNGTNSDLAESDAEAAARKKKAREASDLAAVGGNVNSSLRVFGKVTSAEEHTAIANATLLFFTDDRSNFTIPTQTITNKADGTYEIIVAKDKLPQREGVIAVKADGYASQIAKVYGGRGQILKPVEQNFDLSKGGSISGTVVDFSGKPVALALVGKYQEISRTMLRADNPNQVFPSAESKADGSFELAGLPKTGSMSLITTKRGYIPSLTENISVGNNAVKIVIRQGEGSINGFVYDTDGKIVADVPVKAIFMRKGTRPDFGYPRNPPNVNELYTYTDKEGFYEFPAVLSGWQGVIAGYGSPVSRSVGDSVMLEPGDVKKLNLKFKPPADLQGIVVLKGTDTPIAGVRVANQPEKQEVAYFQSKGGGVGRQESISDGSGRFTMRMDRTVETEMLRFPAEISYALPVTMTGTPEEKWERFRMPFGRNSDDKTEVKIEVEQLTTITGLVLMPDGKTPAIGADVGTQSRRGRFGPPGYQGALENAVKSDSAGKFSVKVGAGVRHTLIARNDTGRAQEDLEVPVEGLKEPVTLTLQAFGSIAGKVSDPDGQPVADVTVSAFQQQGGGGGRGGPGGGGGGRGGGGGFSAVTAKTKADGSYLLEQVLTGTARVNVDEKQDLLRPDAQEVELAEGEAKVGVDFQYQRGVTFEGFVLDSSNQPIVGALVSQGRRFGPGGRRDNSQETDDSGHFKFPAIEPEGDTILLEVTHPSYDTVTKGDLLPEDSPVTIVMPARMHVEFTVAQGGSPISDFQYTITPGRGQPQAVDSSNNGGNPGGRGQRGGGNFGNRGGNRLATVDKTVVGQTDPVKETLTAGTYDLNVYALDTSGAKSGSYGYQSFELTTEKPTAEVKVELGGSLGVAGTVLTTEDKPVANATVEMSRRGGGGNRGGGPPGMPGFGSGTEKTTTDAQGNFSFSNVSVGRVRFTATAPNLVQDGDASAKISLEEAIPPVVVRMTSGASIFGLVIDVDGRPMREGGVRLSGGSGGDMDLDSEGKFKFEKLAPGNYTISLRGGTSGAVISRQDVKLAAAEQKEVNIDFTGYIDVLGQVTRNGAPETDPGTRLTFEPVENGKAININLTRNGFYETRMLPNTYNIYVYSNGGRAKTYTGIQATVQSTPEKQNIDIPLRLESIDVVIVEPDETKTLAGKFVYSHKAGDGKITRTNWESNQKVFTISNQPPGECRGVLTTTDGRKYTSEWTKISEGSEKILTLVPQDVASGS